MVRSAAVLLLLLNTALGFGAEKLLRPQLEAHPVLAKRIQSWIRELDENIAKSRAQENLLRVGAIAHPYLFQALRTPGNAMGKKRVVEILRQVQNKSCVPVLLECLGNAQEDGRVREEAAKALGMFPSPKVLSTLQKYSFHRDVGLQRAASFALCRLSVRGAIPHLIALLKHWDAAIARKAYQRLLEITGRRKAPLDFAAWQQWWNDCQDIFEEQRDG